MYCTSMLLSQELKMLYIRPPINTQQLCLNKYSLRLMSSTGSSGAGGGKPPGAGQKTNFLFIYQHNKAGFCWSVTAVCNCVTKDPINRMDQLGSFYHLIGKKNLSK